MKKTDKKIVDLEQGREEIIVDTPRPIMQTDCQIITDPFGSWTGVPIDNVFDIPIQDVDDL